MKYRYHAAGNDYEIALQRQGASYQAAVNGEAYEVEILDAQPGEISLLFQGHPVILYWASEGDQKWISIEGCTYLLEKPSPQKTRRQGEPSAEDTLRAPMPAQVRSIQVMEGEHVEKGQTILLLEAMKMEIRLQAPREGRIIRLQAVEGQSVDRNQILAEIQ